MIATETDIPKIVEVGKAFHAVSHLSGVEYVPADVEAFLKDLMDRGAVFIGKGMIGVAKQPLYINRSVNLCVEVFFWGLGGGAALLREAEEWARSEGCAFIHAAASEARAAPFYTRAGYEPFGHQFRKAL